MAPQSAEENLQRHVTVWLIRMNLFKPSPELATTAPHYEEKKLNEAFVGHFMHEFFQILGHLKNPSNEMSSEAQEQDEQQASIDGSEEGVVNSIEESEQSSVSQAGEYWVDDPGSVAESFNGGDILANWQFNAARPPPSGSISGTRSAGGSEAHDSHPF